MATDVAELDGLLVRQRSGFAADGPPSLDTRRRRIDLLVSALLDGADDLAAAIAADFGTRARSLSISTDIFGSLVDIAHTRAHVRRWMSPSKVARSASIARLHASIQAQPLGVVGVIAPWNFPINLAVVPAASALAAGNRVMIKMSEKTPRTAELFAALVSQRFSADVLTVVTGGPEVADAFTTLAFDHLFFTGSAQIGRRVMHRAADNLVPVTLELGGKNPAVVGPGADIGEAAERIARARLTNAGQICLCPDYAFVPAAQIGEFVNQTVAAVRKAYPSVVDNDQYCSVVDEASFDRITGLINEARAGGAAAVEIVPPGEILPDRVTRKIAPTLLTGVTPQMRISREEVFGPVLAVHGYDDIRHVIDYVNSHPSPLAAYWYGPHNAEFEDFCHRTRSGGVTRNDFSLHAALPSLPFGGVGQSGMGSYHGKAGFDTFSHRRAIAESDLPFSVTDLTALAPVAAMVAVMLRGYGWLTRLRLRGLTLGPGSRSGHQGIAR